MPLKTSMQLQENRYVAELKEKDVQIRELSEEIIRLKAENAVKDGLIQQFMDRITVN